MLVACLTARMYLVTPSRWISWCAVKFSSSRKILPCLANAGKMDCVTVWRRNAGPIERTTLRCPRKLLHLLLAL